MPIPRWISCFVALLMLVYGCLRSTSCQSSCSANLQGLLPSFAVLMEVWYLDVIVGSTINEVALDEEGVFTNVWLALHASLAVALQCWLWLKKYRSTTRFNFSSHMALSWQDWIQVRQGHDKVMINVLKFQCRRSKHLLLTSHPILS